MSRIPTVTALLLAICFLTAKPALGQSDPVVVSNGTNIGTPENGSFSGSDFDNVQLNNGNLHIEIPLWSLKGRGLSTSMKLVYDSKGWGFHTHCQTSHQTGITTCTDTVRPQTGSHTSLSLVSPESYGTTHSIANGLCGDSNFYYYNYVLSEPNGSAHRFEPDQVKPTSVTFTGTSYVCTWPTGAFLRARDGSGWQAVLNSSGEIDHFISKNGTAVYPSSAKLEDPNGNIIVSSSDTLGRSFGMTSSNSSSYTTSYYDSNGNLQNIVVTYTSVPVQTNACQFSGADTCVEKSGTSLLPGTIALPNGTSYVFSYVPNSYGQPSSVTLPTGGQISWTWNPPVDQSGPILASRTETVGGVSNTWRYNIVPVNYAIVTDPYGNDTKSVFTVVNYGFTDPAWPTPEVYYPPDPPVFETSKQYFQGSASTGTLIKTIQTAYSGAGGTVVPTSVTTTWNQTNQVSKVVTSWDSYPDNSNNSALANTGNITWMNPTQRLEYDWGSGAPGALLRETDYGYLHLANGTYANLNIADRPTSKTIKNGSGTTVAQTLWNYDDPNGSYTYMVADLGGATNHDANRGTSYLTRGNATRVQRWLNSPSSYLVTQNQYDDLGNVRQTTDPKGNTTTFSYADNFANWNCLVVNSAPQAFVYQVTNALGQNTQTAYFGCTGLTDWKRDQNDINAGRYGTSFTYDSMNRPTQIIRPDSGQDIFYYADTAPVMVTKQTAQDSTHNVYSWTQVDGLGRLNRTASSNGEANINILTDQVDTCYDALGRKSFVRYPYQGAGWGNNAYTCTNTNTSNPTATSGPGDAFTYYNDALGRPYQTVNTDGSTSTATYAGNSTMVMDQAGRARKSFTDALGRLTSVCEPNPATGALTNPCTYETDYQYDTLDNLIRVDQKGGTTDSTQWRTRLFTYDSLSRLLTASNPESGLVTYGYDNNGNVTSKTAPAPNQTGSATVTTTYTYDALNRLTGRSYSNTTGASGYVYDSGSVWGVTVQNQIGRMVLSNNFLASGGGNVGTIYSYDAMGRAAFELQVNQRSSTPNQQFNYTYNLDGSLQSITYPSGRKIGYGYPLSGTSNCSACGSSRPVSAIDSANGINYATNAHYTAWGALASLVNGSTGSFAGITSTDVYNSRMQPCRLNARTSSATLSLCTDALPTGSVLDFTYAFNLGAGDNGNVIGITNNRDTTRSQSFTYDYLNRLTSAQSSATSGTNCWGESFAFDMWANLTNRAVTKCTAEPLSVGIGANNRISSAGFAYDAAGNMTQNGSASYSYDAENRLTASAGVTFDYDADGRRVQKSGGTLYWYGADGNVLEETNLSGALPSEYIFFDGRRIARRDQGPPPSCPPPGPCPPPPVPISYYFSDHLGSSSVITNASGVTQNESDFYPFGGERTVGNVLDGINHYKFTGKERDAETGLDYFGARYYANSLGRFESVDPKASSGRSLDPQSWNRYAYARDNPLFYRDPDGRDWEQFVQGLTTIRNSISLKFSAGLGLEAVKTGSGGSIRLGFAVKGEVGINFQTGITLKATGEAALKGNVAGHSGGPGITVEKTTYEQANPDASHPVEVKTNGQIDNTSASAGQISQGIAAGEGGVVGAQVDIDKSQLASGLGQVASAVESAPSDIANGAVSEVQGLMANVNQILTAAHDEDLQGQGAQGSGGGIHDFEFADHPE